MKATTATRLLPSLVIISVTACRSSRYRQRDRDQRPVGEGQLDTPVQEAEASPVDGLLSSLRTRMRRHDPLTQLGSTWSGKDWPLITSDWTEREQLEAAAEPVTTARLDGRHLTSSFIRTASFPRRVARARVEREEEPGEGGSSLPASGRPSGGELAPRLEGVKIAPDPPSCRPWRP
jgi:hypothetical protein